MNLLDQLDQSNYDFYFLVVDELLDISLPELKNFHSLSAQKLGIEISEKNSGRLLSHPTTQQFIKNNSSTTGHTPVIIPFKPSAKIDLICQQNNWILAANPTHLNRFFEDKIKFYQSFSHLPLIPSTIIKLTPENYSQAQQKFGSKLVIQTHFGWAGNSSYISQNYQDISELITTGTTVKISPYLEGYSLINNCCLTQHGLIQSPPGLQYTGLSQITSNPLATVGRQWPSFTPQDINLQVEKITQDFAQSLTEHKYKGFFGLDFFVSNNQVYLIECNPRLTASFALYTTIEKHHQLTPLFFLHLAEFINIPTNENTHFHYELSGSEIVNKKLNRKYQSLQAFSPSANPIAIPSEIIAKVL